MSCTGVLDTCKTLLHNRPHGQCGPAEAILFPRLRELVRLEADLEQHSWPYHMRLQGLSFKHADRMSWHERRIAVQHDWDVFD